MRVMRNHCVEDEETGIDVVPQGSHLWLGLHARQLFDGIAHVQLRVESDKYRVEQHDCSAQLAKARVKQALHAVGVAVPIF